MTDLVPYRNRSPIPAGPGDDPRELVSDITCTRRGCDRTVTASLLEIAWSSPCPLCVTCPECRQLCGQGFVQHGLARDAIR